MRAFCIEEEGGLAGYVIVAGVLAVVCIASALYVQWAKYWADKEYS